MLHASTWTDARVTANIQLSTTDEAGLTIGTGHAESIVRWNKQPGIGFPKEIAVQKAVA
jgi:hypothetical protein